MEIFTTIVDDRLDCIVASNVTSNLRWSVLPHLPLLSGLRIPPELDARGSSRSVVYLK